VPNWRVTGENKSTEERKTHPFRLKKAHWNLVINISEREREKGEKEFQLAKNSTVSLGELF
jgi:hypothetical protein